MREKILAALIAKFSGMSKEALGLLADLGTKKVTEESAIEGFVEELDKSPIPVKDFVDFLQKEGDKRVTTAKAKWEAENKKPEPEKPDPAKPNPDNDPVLEKLAALEAKYAALEAKENKISAQEKLNKLLADKKIPAKFAKGRSVEKEEDVDALVAEIEADYTDFKQEMVNEGLMSGSRPQGGGGATGKADDKEVSSIVDNLLPNI